jgi:hypothetical protein
MMRVPAVRPTRPCRVVGCTRNQRPGMLMCGPCWNRVPMDIKRAVNGAKTGKALADASREALAFVAAKIAEEAGSGATLFRACEGE